MSFFNKLKFVKKQPENDDIYTFFFSRPKGLLHKAGQHGLFIIAGLYRPHPFTISSSPDEEYITISTHVDTGSRYKQKLMEMKAGESIFFLGPLFDFTFNEQAESHVFLAQGIGITPFRSMLVHAHNKALTLKTTLIHVNGNPHSFRKLTEAYATKAYYPTNPDEFRRLVGLQEVGSMFYLSGSPGFVRTTKELLAQLGVKPTNMKTDSFWGY